MVLSSTVGVFLVANAVEDARLVVDGPDCVYKKTQFLQGNHDYLSALTSVAGPHEVVHTDLEPMAIAHDREESVRSLLARVASRPEVGCVLLSAMPIASVLAMDSARLCREARDASGTPVLPVRGRALGEDWLGGYGAGLAALARGLDVERGRGEERSVALVGLLHDRNEEDCRGDVREVRRLLEALGLEVVSVWPDGGPVEALLQVERAGAILSFPYGREAAAVLAERLGARLVECELPFGLEATEGWLRRVGERLGREAEARALLDRELSRVVPRLEWVVPFLFEGSRFGYVGDPHLLVGFRQTVELFGGALAFAVVTNLEHHAEGLAAASGERLLVEPRSEGLLRFLHEEVHDRGIDCLVSNSLCSEIAEPGDCAVVELGFPSYNRHALYDRPTLGFGGALALADAMANAMRLLRAQRDGLSSWKP